MSALETLSLTLPLVKIDEERRLVVARAAHEVEDKSKEIMDYATAKPQFEAWSKGYQDRTNGLSKGNVRAMHNKSHATGRVDVLSFNDKDRAFDVVMKIVDDGDWQKCLDGVYTGVSVGGGYLKKWKDGDLTRYTPIVRELSLVDDPCIPTARFAELVKINGAVEQLELRGVVHTFGDMWASRPAPPPSFAEAWAARPKTFGELSKAFDEGKVKRDEGGKFSAVAGGIAAGAAVGSALHAGGRVTGASLDVVKVREKANWASHQAASGILRHGRIQGQVADMVMLRDPSSRTSGAIRRTGARSPGEHVMLEAADAARFVNRRAGMAANRAAIRTLAEHGLHGAVRGGAKGALLGGAAGLALAGYRALQER